MSRQESLDRLMRLVATMDWNWGHLSADPAVTFADVCEHPYLPWKWSALATNENSHMSYFARSSGQPDVPTYRLRVESINRLLRLAAEVRWDWSAVSGLPDVTFTDVCEHPYLPWNWDVLSANTNLKFTDVRVRPDMPWNWTAISGNTSITLGDVRSHMDEPWDWKSVSAKSTTTMADVIEYADLPWDWTGLSSNRSITMDDVRKNTHMAWDWDALHDRCLTDFEYMERVQTRRRAVRRLKASVLRDTKTDTTAAPIHHQKVGVDAIGVRKMLESHLPSYKPL